MTTEPIAESEAFDPEVPDPSARAREHDRRAPRHRRWNRSTIARGLESGRLKRLRLGPPEVLTTIIGSGCSSVQVQTGCVTAQLELQRSRWRLNANDVIELDSAFGEGTFSVANWSYLYADAERARMAALGRRGGLLAEWDLERWRGGGGIGETGTAHRAQQPPSTEHDMPDFEVHAETFRAEVFADAWRRSASFRETSKLQKAARTDRASLLSRLPRSAARAVDPAAARGVVGQLPAFEGAAALELHAPGHDVSAELRDVDARTAGDVSIVHSDGLDVAIDWTSTAGAYLVTLPVEGRLARALEFVDARGDLAFRLRRRYEAEPSEVFDWRATIQANGPL